MERTEDLQKKTNDLEANVSEEVAKRNYVLNSQYFSSKHSDPSNISKIRTFKN